MVCRWGENESEGDGRAGGKDKGGQKTRGTNRVFERSVGRDTLWERAGIGPLAPFFGFKMALTFLPWCEYWLSVCYLYLDLEQGRNPDLSLSLHAACFLAAFQQLAAKFLPT